MGRFVLVHGGFVGGWSWEKLVPLLEGAGHRVEAPNLLGSGDDRPPIAEVSLQAMWTGSLGAGRPSRAGRARRAKGYSVREGLRR